MMDVFVFERIFGSRCMLRVIEVMLDSMNMLTATEIAERIGMSYPQVRKVLKDLEKMGVIYSPRKVGNIKLYNLDTDFPAYHELVDLHAALHYAFDKDDEEDE